MQLDHNVICHFRFICSERWEYLSPIAGDPNKRFCDVCSSPVYLTSNYEELETNISAKRCVAIFLENSQESQREFMGLVVPAMSGSPDAFDPVLARPLDDLEITPEILSKLRANNVQLIGDLVQCTPSQLFEQIGVTHPELNELSDVLASRGLTTGMHLENWGPYSEKFR